ncbi:MAG: 30S ribosomal protein S6 [Anaerolineae bacterium]
MNEYELMFIVQPNADEARQEAIKQRIADYVTSNQGEVTNVRDWGHRRLAFPIRRQASGFYVVMRLRLLPKAVEELQRLLRLNEDVLRFLMVRAEEVPTPA